MNQGKTLLFIQKSDVFGQVKAMRLVSYYNELFRQNPDANVTPGQILKFSKKSRSEITELRHTLAANRTKAKKPENKTTAELLQELDHLT